MNATTVAANARCHTVELWQARWEAKTKVAAWTRRILPSVSRWVERPSGTFVSFYLAQVLSGHGDFAEYLHHFGLLGSSECPHYQVENDDVEHTFMKCPQWSPT